MQNNKTVCRVVHIISDLALGGSEMMLYKLLAHTDRRQFEPIVITLNIKDDLKERISAHGIPVYTFTMQAGFVASWQLLPLAWLLLKLKPDIIQGWMYLGNIVATLTNSLLGNRYPVVWNIRHSIPDQTQLSYRLRKLLQWGARLSTKPVQIIYDTKTHASQHQALGYCANHTKVIPNGFDTYLFRPNTYTRRLVRQELVIPKGSIVIGMIANYNSTSNHALFIQAATELHKHYKNYKQVHFILVGREVTQNNLELATLKAQSGLPKQIHLLGERRDIPALLNAMDIFTLTTQDQGFPHTLGEAMACGLPCVMAKVDEANRLVSEDVYLLEHFAPSNLAALWDQWLKTDESTLKALGQRAIQCIKSNYTISQVTTQFQTCYHDIRSKNPTNEGVFNLMTMKRNGQNGKPA